MPVLVLALSLSSPLVLVEVAGAAPRGTPPKVARCRGATKKAAIKAIKATYDTVFNASPDTPIDERADLIESADDPAFRALLDTALLQAGTQVTELSATVKKVRCTARRRATVKYNLLGLLPTRGTAMLVDGSWKVSQREVCDLLARFDPTLDRTTGPCGP